MDLVFKPEGWWGRRFRVQLAHGPAVGRIDLGAWRTRAEVVLPTGTCVIRKDPDGALVLYREGRPEAQAVQRSALRPRFDVEWPGGKGTLAQRSSWGHTFVLDADGTEIASLKRSGWTGRVQAHFPSDWPLERALFVAAVALGTWESQDAAAVVATG